MALISKRNTSSSSAVQRQQKIQVNPYEIQENVLEMIGKIAAQKRGYAIGEYWKIIDDFFFNAKPVQREIWRNEHWENEWHCFRDYFYNFRREFGEPDFLRIAYDYMKSLSWEIQANTNTRHTRIAVAGGFSAGKSSFLNKQTGANLPIGTEATSVVLTYLYCDSKQTQVEVQGENIKNAIMTLDTDILEGIKHTSGYSCHFASVLNKLLVKIPAKNSDVDGLAFIDTPGYDNTTTENATNGKTDMQTAQEGLDDAHVLIWLVDITKGTLRAEDIDVINEFDGAKLIIFNKADKARSECHRIVEDAYNKLITEDNQSEYIDVLAYSTMTDEILYSKKGYRTMSQVISEIKKQGNGLSGQKGIEAEIKQMFDNEEKWTEDAINRFKKRYEDALADEKTWNDCLKSWEEGVSGSSDWAKGVIIESYDDILDAADKLGKIASESIDTIYNLENDSWGYINSKFSSSDDLVRILNRYKPTYESLCKRYDKAIDYSYYKEEGRQNLVKKFDSLYEYRINAVKTWLDEAKDKSASQLFELKNQEKYLEDIKVFKDYLLFAIKQGKEAYEQAKNRGTNKVSLNSDNSNAKDVFSAIDTDDIKQFTKCFVKPVDMSVCNPSGYSPLTYAVESGNNDMVKFLLDCGADPNAYDNRGYNAFHTAVENEYKDMCEMLLKDSPDLIDSKTRNGESVEDLLEKQTFKKWIKNKL